MHNIQPKGEFSHRVRSFSDLEMYHKATDLDLAIFRASKSWPKGENFSLIDQIRRSSRSIGANIAEAWAKRHYPAHFTSKLTDADAELQETKHWLHRANAYGYLSDQDMELLMNDAQFVGSQIGAMLRTRDRWTVAAH
ncbi:MAG: four helix bundle protein [Opitutaceae bacterium]|jgi:four helix bundle protein